MNISLAIAAFSGFILGMIYSLVTIRRNPDGIFLVNLKDPNDEIFKLQIDLPIEKIPSVKYLIFKVKNVQ